MSIDLSIDPNWFQLLQDEARRTSMTQVSARLGYSRTSISLVLSGKYLGKTDKVAKRVTRILAQAVPCPFLHVDLPAEECRENCAKRAPTHNPTAMAHWRYCQKCPHNRSEK